MEKQSKQEIPNEYEAMTRVEWMHRDGTDIYTAWTEAAIEAGRSRELIEPIATEYHRVMGARAQRGEDPIDADCAIDMLVGRQGALPTLLRTHPATAILLDHSNEIQHFTSAGSSHFLSVYHDIRPTDRYGEVHPLIVEALAKATIRVKTIDHGIDAFRFGVNSAYRVARDFAIQEESDAWKSTTPWHNGWESWPTTPERLRAICAILRDPTYIQCLEAISVTGFAVLQEAFALDNAGSSRSPAKHTHAEARAVQTGIYDLYTNGEAYSILHRDDEGQLVVRPQVVSYLQSKLREQNKNGLLTDREDVAGNLIALNEKHGGRGFGDKCPVAESPQSSAELQGDSGIAQTSQYLAWFLETVNATLVTKYDEHQ